MPPYRPPTGRMTLSYRHHPAVVPPSWTYAGTVIFALVHRLGYHHHLALVPTSLYPPSTNASTGEITIGYRHHLALVPPARTVMISFSFKQQGHHYHTARVPTSLYRRSPTRVPSSSTAILAARGCHHPGRVVVTVRSDTLLVQTTRRELDDATTLRG